MRSRISIRGCVRPSVRPSVRRSHTSWNLAKPPFLTKSTGSTSENASYAVYPALFFLMWKMATCAFLLALTFIPNTPRTRVSEWVTGPRKTCFEIVPSFRRDEKMTLSQPPLPWHLLFHFPLDFVFLASEIDAYRTARPASKANSVEQKRVATGEQKSASGLAGRSVLHALTFTALALVAFSTCSSRGASFALKIYHGWAFQLHWGKEWTERQITKQKDVTFSGIN